MRSMTELTDSLNQYLKQYCEESKKMMEEQMQKLRLDHQEKLQSLEEKLDDSVKS